jgi:hypothetical protein
MISAPRAGAAQALPTTSPIPVVPARMQLEPPPDGSSLRAENPENHKLGARVRELRRERAEIAQRRTWA